MISNVIKIKLAEILEKQDKSLYKLQQETGLSYTTLWKINKNGVQGITFDVLEKLCKSLDCTPNDLLEVKK